MSLLCPERVWLATGGKQNFKEQMVAPLAGNRADHRRLFHLIQQMQQEGKIKFTQLIAEDDYRWLHISYVPSDLRCQVIE